MGSKILHLDRFAHVPSLNFKGRTKISTVPGLIVTVLLTSILFWYSVKKFIDLVTRANPTVNELEIQRYFNDDDTLDLNEIGFKIAFGISDYHTSRNLVDPDYLQFKVSMKEKSNGIRTFEELKVHKCTDHDFDQFYKPDFGQFLFDSLRNSSLMYCIDEGQDLTIRGQ